MADTDAYVERDDRHCRCNLSTGQHCSICPRHTNAAWPEYGDGGPNDPSVTGPTEEGDHG